MKWFNNQKTYIIFIQTSPKNAEMTVQLTRERCGY